MQLIILKNGNAINTAHVKQFFIDDELGKICVYMNGNSTPICIYDARLSHVAKEYGDKIGFTWLVLKKLYAELTASKTRNINMRWLEEDTMAKINYEKDWKKHA